MNYLCGSFQIKCSEAFGDYSDLVEFVSRSGVDGFLLGEDASDFMTFHAVEVSQPFTGAKFRIGIILDGSRDLPEMCPVHANATLAIGMNNGVRVVELENRALIGSIELDSWFHHFLCNGKVLVAVHELGAKVIQLPEFQEIADVYCEVVADATLSESELVLTSMDDDSTRVDLTAVGNQYN